MLRSIKTKFTAVFLIVLVITLIVFSFAIYGFVNSEMYKPGQKMQVGWMIKNHPERFRGIESIDKELYEEIREYIESEERERFKQLVFTLLVPTIIISGALAYATAYYLVKPIEDLADDVESLGDGDFQRRLEAQNDPEEIRYLRDVFNSMLDKVESAFLSQEEFIQDAAHELRTPLASMRAHLHLIKKKGKVSKEDYEEAIEVLSRMNEKLVKLSEDLLYLDRRKVAKKEKINPSELINDVIESFSPLIKQKDLQIKKNYEYKEMINADPMSLARAFENIIENSIKYGARKIKISTQSDNGNLLIRFVDDGDGISEKDLDHIFDRFYRGDSEKVVDGSGLGLSIVQKIITDHQGTIAVNSQQGKGTRVNISIPKGI